MVVILGFVVHICIRILIDLQEKVAENLDVPFKKLNVHDLSQLSQELRHVRIQRTLMLEEAEQHASDICKLVAIHEHIILLVICSCSTKG